MFHLVRNDWIEAGKDSKRTPNGSESKLICCDLFPDGRITSNETLADLTIQPGTLFPRLPIDRHELAKGWVDDRVDGFEHCNFSAEPPDVSKTTWAIRETSQMGWDKIYRFTWRAKYFFDLRSNSIERVELENTQGSSIEGKGTETVRRVAVSNHDQQWAKNFADDADRYFAAMREYRGSLREAGLHLKNVDDNAARAEEVLKKARAAVTDITFTEQLDHELAGHSGQVKEIKVDLKEIAAVKSQPPLEWKLDDLNGKSHTLKEYQGRVVVLDFWYRGCGWCIRSMPDVQRLADDFKEQPVQVLGMNIDKDENDARFVADAMGISYPVLRASKASAEYRVHGCPTLIVIDQHGVVRDVRVGYSKTMRSDLTKVIKDLIRTK